MTTRREVLAEMFSPEKMILAEDFANRIITDIKILLKTNKVPPVLIEGVMAKELINIHRWAEEEKTIGGKK